jgi:hypothetical protein
LFCPILSVSSVLLRACISTWKLHLPDIPGQKLWHRIK